MLNKRGLDCFGRTEGQSPEVTALLKGALVKNMEKRARKKVNTEQNREHAKSNKRGNKQGKIIQKTNNTEINIREKIQRLLRPVANGENVDGVLFSVTCCNEFYITLVYSFMHCVPSEIW